MSQTGHISENLGLFLTPTAPRRLIGLVVSPYERHRIIETSLPQVKQRELFHGIHVKWPTKNEQGSRPNVNLTAPRDQYPQIYDTLFKQRIERDDGILLYCIIDFICLGLFYMS